jgi:SAM-dependent methyltransferase
VRRDGGELVVAHDFSPEELSDELAVLIADELGETGVLARGQTDFEQVFTGIVRSTVDGALPAWLRFYRNSLDRLQNGSASFAPVYQHAAEVIRGRQLIDLGCCFGFFPLRLARHIGSGDDIVATDVSRPTIDLLSRASAALQRPLRTICCDAAHVPLPDGSADTVTALHLIEHLGTAKADDVLDEAIRLARRRVVVAVPFEETPRDYYGHVQQFNPAALDRLAAQILRKHPGLAATVGEYHGGWLIIDRA